VDFVLPAWFEIVALAVLVVILAADLLIVLKRPRVPSMKEATAWVGFYVALALAFAGVLFWVSGSADAAGQFVAGWLTEYSLSVDNLFVFVLLMTQFAVPRRYQQEVLMVGILIALVLRGVFIVVGATLIENFVWIFYLFGLFLVYTAWRQAFPGKTADDARTETTIVRILRRFVDIADEYDGARLRTEVNGKKIFTPMILVFLAIGVTDLLFAIDSIPAIFGITRSPFIVFAANLFALMGLRQLYFLLGGLLDRLRYLHYGIAFILAFIGIKLFLHALHENTLPFVADGAPVRWAPEVSTTTSLCVIVAAMLVATIASMIASGRERRAAGTTGDSARIEPTHD
jgi:tellurite resistance protein TerC